MHQFQCIPRNEVSSSEQNLPPQKHFSKLVNNNTTLNLNTTSYFLIILYSTYVSTCYTTGEHICFGPTKHHQRIVERTWLMVNICKYMGVQYTGNNIQHFGQPYL